jgi:hypothetical protein
MVKENWQKSIMDSKKTAEFYVDFKSAGKEFFKSCEKSCPLKSDVKMDFCLQRFLA